MYPAHSVCRLQRHTECAGYILATALNGRSYFAARGSGSLGFTPYFFCRARPQGQPPKVMNVSMACRNWAKRFPFLALVQTGQEFSQKSGSNPPPFESLIFVLYPRFTTALGRAHHRR